MMMKSDGKGQNDLITADKGNELDLDSMSNHQIRSMLEEMMHQLRHLERSQEELLDAIQACPPDEPDEDFALAFWENSQVIERRKARYEEMSEHLKKVDPAYRRECIIEALAKARAEQEARDIQQGILQSSAADQNISAGAVTNELDNDMEDMSISSQLASRRTNSITTASSACSENITSIDPSSEVSATNIRNPDVAENGLYL